jgi:hypothetical protein
MSVKAVEMVRKIRDRHYQILKDLSIAEQIEFYRKKSQELQAWLKKKETAKKPRQVLKKIKRKKTIVPRDHHEQRSPR